MKQKFYAFDLVVKKLIMKKHIIFFTIVLFSNITTILNAQHVLGRWMIPLKDGANMEEPWQLNFYDNNITYDVMLQTPSQNNIPVSGSAGAYNSNLDRDFYIIDNYIYYGLLNTNLFPQNGTLPEIEVVQKPGVENEYYAIGVYDAYNSACFIKSVHINFDPTTEIITKVNEMELREFDGGYGGFAVSGLHDNNTRSLYTVSTRVDQTILGGIYKRTISSNGISQETAIIEEGTSGLTDMDFEAYNVEYIKNSIGEEFIAWIHGGGDEWYGQDPNEILIVKVSSTNPVLYRIDNLNLGMIGGIEFSNFEDNIIYASTTNGGLIKLDYTLYSAPNYNYSYVQNAPSNNYQQTFIQTAPDGHIYAVANNGLKLGRILQSGTNEGTFDNNYEYVFTDGTLTYEVASYTYFSPKNYYVLPENHRVWKVLEVDVIPENVSCPGYTDGSVQIYVSGGAPFAPPLDPYNILCTSHSSLTFTWDNDGFFEATNLAEGIYTCVITDAYNNPKEVTFIIDVDFDDYTYKEHVVLGEVMGSVTVPLTFNNETVSFAKGFTVNDGTIATFTNCTVLMGPRAEIYVKSGTIEDIENGIAGVNGALLTINETTITNHAACNEAWEGIEVWGNRNESQLPGANGLVYQGKLIVENSSIISNAYNAIKNREGDSFNTSGGIILVEESDFLNNKRSVEMLSYYNTNPYNADIRLPYISKFKLCTFTYNDNYIIPDDFNAHITMWDVEGIHFYGCAFENNTTNNILAGYGLFTSNAGYSIQEICTSDFEPCPEIIQCSFNNLFTGIHATNSFGSGKIVQVFDAKFTNNSVGVYLENENYATIVNCVFQIGENLQTKASCDNDSYSFGIDAHTCIGFAFEDNEFSKFPGAATGYYTGIRVYECRSDIDIIYNNTFDGLSFGNYAYGMNRADLTDRTGVIYKCNTNTNNAIDFIVTHENENVAMIHTHQGIPDMEACGNSFSEITDNDDWNFRNEGKENINWYYCNDQIACPDQTPVKYYHTGTLQLPLFTPDVEPQNSCPSHYGGGNQIKLSSSQRLQAETEFALNLADFNNVEALFIDLKDGGSTDNELLDIQTALPDDMWTIRAQLLGDSPHLSEEVLKEVADRTDVFPDQAIFDIVAANPDEIDKDLIEYLENKEEPLPNYMISLLEQLSGGTTYKTALLNDMNQYHYNKTKAAQDIIRNILADSIVDFTDYRNWLDNVGGMYADKEIIVSYLSEGNTQDALALLNLLPPLYELEGIDLDFHNEYNDLISMKVNLINQGRNIFSLTLQEQAYLLDLTVSQDPVNSSIAKSILRTAYAYQDPECQYISNINVMKQNIANESYLSGSSGIKVSVLPNPATNWAQFYYSLPLDTDKGIIEISDISGRLISTVVLNSNEGKLLLDTRKFEKGVYLYTVKASARFKSGKLIISK